jgi:hypothetical protein
VAQSRDGGGAPWADGRCGEPLAWPAAMCRATAQRRRRRYALGVAVREGQGGDGVGDARNRQL